MYEISQYKVHNLKEEKKRCTNRLQILAWLLGKSNRRNRSTLQKSWMYQSWFNLCNRWIPCSVGRPKWWQLVDNSTLSYVQHPVWQTFYRTRSFG